MTRAQIRRVFEIGKFFWLVSKGGEKRDKAKELMDLAEIRLGLQRDRPRKSIYGT